MKVFAGVVVGLIVILVLLTGGAAFFEATSDASQTQFVRHMELLEALLSWEVVSAAFAGLIGVALKDVKEVREQRVDVSVDGVDGKGEQRKITARGDKNRVAEILREFAATS